METTGCYGCRCLAQQLADAQATGDALQAQLESANTLLHKKNCAIGKAETTIEALQAKVSELQGIADEKCRCFLERAEQSEKQLTQRTAELEVLQRERDEAIEALDCVLTEKPLPSGEYVHRVSCNGDRRKPAGTVGVSCSCHPGRAALDAELEKVAFVEKTAADFQELWRTACDQREAFETQLAQLQALVRALPVVHGDVLTVAYFYAHRKQVDIVEQVKALLKYRATLDATSKAGGNK